MNEKVFRDPVHDYVHVDHPIIYQLINSKNFNDYAASNNWGHLVLPSTVGSIVVFLTVLAPMKFQDAFYPFLRRSMQSNGILMKTY